MEPSYYILLATIVSSLSSALGVDSVIKSSVSGLLGNFTDRVFVNSYKNVKTLISQKEKGIPENQDLLILLKISMLDSTLEIIESMKQERLERKFRRKIRRWITKEKKGKYDVYNMIELSNHFDNQLDILLGSKQEFASNREILKEKISESWLAYIQKKSNLQLPQIFKERILQGWYIDGNLIHWSEVSTVFFMNYLKSQNSEISNRAMIAFEVNFLSDIKSTVNSLVISQNEKNKLIDSIIWNFQRSISSIQELRIGLNYIKETVGENKKSISNIESFLINEYKELKDELKETESKRLALMSEKKQNQVLQDELKNKANQLRNKIDILIEENKSLRDEHYENSKNLIELLLEQIEDINLKKKIEDSISDGNFKNVKKVIQNYKAVKSPEEIAKMYFELAIANELEQKYIDALQNFQKAFEKNTNNPLYRLYYGNILTTLGQYKLAEEILSIITIPSNSDSRLQIVTCISLNNLAESLRHNGKPEESIDLLKIALDIYKKSKLDSIRQLHMLKNNIGLAFLDVSKFQDALSCFEECIEIIDTEPKLDWMKNEEPRIDNNISETYLRLSGVSPKKQSKIFLKKALDFSQASILKGEVVFKVPNIQLAYYYYTAGKLSRETGMISHSFSLFNYSLNNSRKLFGKNHSLIGLTYGEIANTYLILREFQTAINYYVQSLNILRNFYDDDHKYIIIVSQNYHTALKYIK